MILILEGVDKSGKTTLANIIAKKNDSFLSLVSHDKQPKDITNREDFYYGFNLAYKAIEEAFLQNNKDLVIDRFVLSEYVYAKAYSRPSKIDNKFVDSVFYEKPVYCVLLECTYDEHCERCKNCQEEIIEKDNFELQLQLFRKKFSVLKNIYPNQFFTFEDFNKNLKNIGFQKAVFI